MAELDGFPLDGAVWQELIIGPSNGEKTLPPPPGAADLNGIACFRMGKFFFDFWFRAPGQRSEQGRVGQAGSETPARAEVAQDATQGSEADRGRQDAPGVARYQDQGEGSVEVKGSQVCLKNIQGDLLA